MVIWTEMPINVVPLDHSSFRWFIWMNLISLAQILFYKMFNRIEYLTNVWKITVWQLLHWENHFQSFVVFCCCVFETKYTEFHFINFKSSCHMNSTTFRQWEVHSIANIFWQKLTLYEYFTSVFMLFLYYYVLDVRTGSMHSECCISWCQTVWWCIT